MNRSQAHCDERPCWSTLEESGRCECPCEACRAAQPAAPPQVPARLYRGGYWLQGQWAIPGPTGGALTAPKEGNAWGSRETALVFPHAGHPNAVAMAKLFPGAWAIADKVSGVTVHCGHPDLCIKRRAKSGGCCCGCPDCTELTPERPPWRPEEMRPLIGVKKS